MIHDALRFIRLFHDYSIEKTSLVVGIDPSDIRNIESGKLAVSDVTIEKYAQGFKMKTEDIKFFLEVAFSDERKEMFWIRGQVSGVVLSLLDWIYAHKEQ